MEQELKYYRIKTEWMAQSENGNLKKTKTEELVYATSYGEAEKLAYAVAEDRQRGRYGAVKFDIIKTNIDELMYNKTLQTEDTLTEKLNCCFFEESDETGVGLYAVKVMYNEIDPVSAKEKRSNETIYVPASSNINAAKLVNDYLKVNETTRDFVVRDTKFDKAEAIFLPTDIYAQKVKKFDEYLNNSAL